jgi:hypothetical protein
MLLYAVQCPMDMEDRLFKNHVTNIYVASSKMLLQGMKQTEPSYKHAHYTSPVIHLKIHGLIMDSKMNWTYSMYERWEINIQFKSEYPKKRNHLKKCDARRWSEFICLRRGSL